MSVLKYFKILNFNREDKIKSEHCLIGNRPRAVGLGKPRRLVKHTRLRVFSLECRRKDELTNLRAQSAVITEFPPRRSCQQHSLLVEDKATVLASLREQLPNMSMLHRHETAENEPEDFVVEVSIFAARTDYGPMDGGDSLRSKITRSLGRKFGSSVVLGGSEMTLSPQLGRHIGVVELFLSACDLRPPPLRIKI
ncbi:unnamed protein product [Caenorhabditis auriculariae]|uniref:Uncharacterized protein n=1 Tax=Caenorhabditis auriculariae TaxID=2777116 RepID=A0A8S1H4G8_9PELO|nr:unnamed protein product [Caenorhabditis auriculariae]